MGKRLQIILLTLLFAAASLYGGHLVSVSREKTQVYDALAQQPIQTVQAISPENLQFAVKSRYFGGSGYVDCVLTSPERTPFYPADTVVGAADEQMMKAVRTVVSSLGIYDYDWSSERPAVAPGKSNVTLSFFQGEEMTAKAAFTIDGSTLCWQVEENGGWLVCRYTVDREALEILANAPYDLYLNRKTP